MNPSEQLSPWSRPEAAVNRSGLIAIRWAPTGD